MFDGEKWTQLKFKWSLGLSNNLQACCTPISDNKILIVGGSNGNVNDLSFCYIELNQLISSNGCE